MQSGKSTEKMAKQLFLLLQTDLPDDAQVPKLKRERVSTELLYLSMFLTDLAVYLTFRDTPERSQLMERFWNLVSTAGLNMDVVGERMQAYSESSKAATKHEAFVQLGKTFAWHCLALGDDDIATLGEAAAESHLEVLMTLLAES